MKKDFSNKKETQSMDTNMAASSEKLSELIKASLLKDREIADQMNLSVQAVNKWRHGKSFPDYGNLYFLSRILGVSVDDFFVAA